MAIKLTGAKPEEGGDWPMIDGFNIKETVV